MQVDRSVRGRELASDLLQRFKKIARQHLPSVKEGLNDHSLEINIKQRRVVAARTLHNLTATSQSMETVMDNVSNYYLVLDAAKDARAQQISCLVHEFTTRMVAKLHPQRGGAGHAALVAAQPAAPGSSPRLIAAHPPPSAAAEQRISGCFRESSPSLS